MTEKFSRIGKSYSFSAAHHLTGVPSDHPCARLHGHNYRVEVELFGKIDPFSGFACGMDFADLDRVIKPIIERLDHQLLNDFVANPTAENLAIYVAHEIDLVGVVSVRVWETDKCWAEVAR